MKQIALISAIIFMLCNIVFAQNPIDVDRNPYQNLGKETRFYEDKTRKLGIDQILKLPDSNFHYGKNNIFNGRSKGGVWWFKTKYKQSSISDTYLVLDYGNIDFIDIYYTDSLNKIKHIKSGTFSSSSSRSFLTSEYIFHLPNNNKSTDEIYVRLNSVNTLIAPIKLVNGVVLNKSLFSKYVTHLLYIGVVLALFLFNLFMLFYTRNKLYGMYLVRIFLLFYIYVLGYLNGYAHFFGDQVSRLVLIHAQVFAGIGFIATIAFNISYLKLKEVWPKSIKWFYFLCALWFVVLLFSFWDTRVYTNKIIQFLIFVTSIALLLSSIRVFNIKAFRKKNPFVAFYLIGWMPICFACIYVVLTLIDVLPMEDFTFKILLFAAILEAILITISIIGDNLHGLRIGKQNAEAENVLLIKERNAYLEQKIEERTQEIQLVNQELKNSNAYKDKLFSIIAHDMRSPLSSLKMVLQMADRDMIDAERLSKLLVGIRKNTEKVQAVMDNLLNWSIAQMDMQRYRPEPIEIEFFLKEHFALYEDLAEEKSITVNIYSSKDIVVFADKNQLSLIIRNLIDNAIKYTPKKGKINIGIKKKSGIDIIFVANSGPVLSLESIQEILSIDKKLIDSTDTYDRRGTGLGLRLCREFIKNLGSEMSVESSSELGEVCTIFSFEVPLYKDDDGFQSSD